MKDARAQHQVGCSVLSHVLARPAWFRQEGRQNMGQECWGPGPEGEAWGLFSFPGEAQGLCYAHVLSPPGLLLLCEAVRAGVLADPHGPVCELPGNGFAGTAGAFQGQGMLWGRQRSLGQSGHFRCSKFWRALLPPHGKAEPHRAFCSHVPSMACCLSRCGVQ